MKTRLSLGLGAGAAAALATAALMAGAGSAQTPATTLHLVSTSQKGAGFMPKGAPHQGDRLGFGDRITGDDTGYRPRRLHHRRQAADPVHDPGPALEGHADRPGHAARARQRTPVAIIGGTGAYNGARGTALVTDHGNGRTDVEITLLP